MSSQTAKAERATMYAQWLRDDADGLAHNIEGIGLSPAEQFRVLQIAKQKLSEAIQKIDGAIVANRLNEGSAA